MVWDEVRVTRVASRRIARSVLLAVVAVIGVPRVANAEEQACRDDYEHSQELMKPKAGPSTLLPARATLRSCMRSGCKDWVVADCSKWLAEVEERIPTVVFSARDTAGRDLTDVRVTTADGLAITPRLDGRALDIEPGRQTFVFVTPDGVRREKDVLIREGEKSQSVGALFDAPPGLLPPSSGPAGGVPSTQPPPPTTKLRYAGYAATGVGVLGLGLGAVFGLRAIGKKDSAGCDDTNACANLGAVDEAKDASTVANVGFIVGGVLTAAGVALILLSPTSSSRHSAQLRPAVGSSAAGLELGAHW